MKSERVEGRLRPGGLYRIEGGASAAAPRRSARLRTPLKIACEPRAHARPGPKGAGRGGQTLAFQGPIARGERKRPESSSRFPLEGARAANPAFEREPRQGALGRPPRRTSVPGGRRRTCPATCSGPGRGPRGGGVERVLPFEPPGDAPPGQKGHSHTTEVFLDNRSSGGGALSREGACLCQAVEAEGFLHPSPAVCPLDAARVGG